VSTEKTVLQLVGSNPLPLYIAATSLSATAAVLIHTPQTLPVARRLSAVYKRTGMHARLVEIRDGTSAEDCALAVKPEDASAYLDYTGGQKVMAVHVYMEWLRRGGNPSRALYVDSLSGRLRFDGGSSIAITTQLSLQVMAKLHGCRIAESRRVNVSPGFRNEVEKEMRVLIKNLDRGGKNHAEKGWWLEELMAILLHQTGMFQDEDIHVGVKILRSRGPPMELDVVALRGHIAYVVSCSVSRNYAVCRSKAFEVVLRGRQLAGDQVRTALVCPIGFVKDSYRKGRIVDRRDNLEETIRDHWNNPISFRVFGLDDIKTWLGMSSRRHDTSLVKEWISQGGNHDHDY